MAISTADAKSWLRVTTSDDDTLIAAMVVAAYTWAENYCGIVIEPRTGQTQTYDAWGDYLEIDDYPVTSVASVQYVDGDGNTQTWSSSLYVTDARSGKTRIYPAYGETFPTVRAKRHAITVTYACGYSDYPKDMETAIKLIVGNFYEQRENFVAGMTITEIPLSAQMMLNPYRMNLA